MHETLAPQTAGRNWVFYAHLGDTEGTAELIATGFIFRPDDPFQRIRIVGEDNMDLVLHGCKQLADAQRKADQAAGGHIAAILNHNGRR